MTLPKKEDYIFYQAKTGKIPAKEYLEKESLDIQVKLSALVKYIADHGRLFDITKFRKVDSKDNIFEFKPVNHRFFSFFYKGKKIIITNAYIKKSQKVSKGDLEKARNMKKAYADRIKGGIYYEKN